MGKNPGPYRRLQAVAMKWASKVVNPNRREMYQFDDAALRKTWNLKGIAERVAAARTLGWDTHLTFRDGTLHITYVERPPDIPGGFHPW